MQRKQKKKQQKKYEAMHIVNDIAQLLHRHINKFVQFGTKENSIKNKKKK